MSLPQRLRSYLKVRAARRGTTTYRDLAKALELDPPNVIHQVTEALEVLMHEDHEDGAPFIAALVVSKARSGVPAPGFFQLAGSPGRYGGPDAGPDTEAHHAREIARAWSYWGGEPTH